jgi:hypothetical protein
MKAELTQKQIEQVRLVNYNKPTMIGKVHVSPYFFHYPNKKCKKVGGKKSKKYGGKDEDEEYEPEPKTTTRRDKPREKIDNSNPPEWKESDETARIPAVWEFPDIERQPFDAIAGRRKRGGRVEMNDIVAPTPQQVKIGGRNMILVNGEHQDIDEGLKTMKAGKKSGRGLFSDIGQGVDTLTSLFGLGLKKKGGQRRGAAGEVFSDLVEADGQCAVSRRRVEHGRRERRRPRVGAVPLAVGQRLRGAVHGNGDVPVGISSVRCEGAVPLEQDEIAGLDGHAQRRAEDPAEGRRRR